MVWSIEAFLLTLGLIGLFFLGSLMFYYALYKNSKICMSIIVAVVIFVTVVLLYGISLKMLHIQG